MQDRHWSAASFFQWSVTGREAQKKSLCHIMSAALPKSIPDIPFCGILDDSMILFAFVSVSQHFGTQFLKSSTVVKNMWHHSMSHCRWHRSQAFAAACWVPRCEPLALVQSWRGQCGQWKATGRTVFRWFSKRIIWYNIIKRYQQVSGIAAEEEKVYWAGCRSAEDEMDPYDIWKPWYLWI